MCTCGCAQLLGECNHVGCPSSGPMLNELSAAIASGATDQQILSSFAAKYGITVLAAPPTHGFRSGCLDRPDRRLRVRVARNHPARPPLVRRPYSRSCRAAR